MQKFLKHGRARSIVALMVAAVGICCVFAFPHTHAKDPASKPYSATTVDECIQEKECVWYHLLLAVQADPMAQKITRDLNVRKWEEPIFFRVVAHTEGINGERISSWFKSVARFTTQDISGAKNQNFLILLTDDIEKELEFNYGELFQDVFGDDRILKHYRNGPKKRGDKCHYVLLQDPQYYDSIAAYYSFIQKDHLDFRLV